MDINGLKGRIAEALVESIFRRAQYRVARAGRESQIPGLMQKGAAEFAPDFMVWREVEGARPDEHLHRLLMVEVKYRANPQEYFKTYFEPFIEAIRGSWPDLYCVIVTDNPDEGRSCFQVLAVKDCTPGQPPPLQDLQQRFPNDIYKTTVAEYENLVRQLFALLNVASG